jgi:hypothetical protein
MDSVGSSLRSTFPTSTMAGVATAAITDPAAALHNNTSLDASPAIPLPNASAILYTLAPPCASGTPSFPALPSFPNSRMASALHGIPPAAGGPAFALADGATSFLAPPSSTGIAMRVLLHDG